MSRGQDFYERGCKCPETPCPYHPTPNRPFDLPTPAAQPTGELGTKAVQFTEQDKATLARLAGDPPQPVSGAPELWPEEAAHIMTIRRRAAGYGTILTEEENAAIIREVYARAQTFAQSSPAGARERAESAAREIQIHSPKSFLGHAGMCVCSRCENALADIIERAWAGEAGTTDVSSPEFYARRGPHCPTCGRFRDMTSESCPDSFHAASRPAGEE